MPLDIFHHQVFIAAFFAHVQHALNIGVINAIANLGLTLIPLEDPDIANQIVVGELQHHCLLIMKIFSEVDTAHPPMPKHADNFVVIYLRTWCIYSWHNNSTIFPLTYLRVLRAVYHCLKYSICESQTPEKLSL